MIARREEAFSGGTRWRETDVVATIPEHFARQAARHPDHPAIAAPASSLTYAELDSAAARYVALLRRRVKPGDRVALLLPHDADLVASALAALRLACAVVVLNPIDPPARLAQILTDAEPAVLLTHDSYWNLAHQARVPDPRIELISSASKTEPAEPNEHPPSTDDLAFLISTSGSTGKPKLVMQTHRGMLHQVLRYTHGLGIDHRDRVSLLLSLSGGRGLGATWTTLVNGATLCPFPTGERGVAGLADWLEGERVSVFDTLPSILRSLAHTLPADRRIGCVRLVRLASEPAFKSDFEAYRRHFPLDSVLVHGLASSEAGMIAFARIGPDDALPDGPLAVGRVADGLIIRLLDEHSRPVPSGGVGEIVVGGGPLSRGYWRDSQLTDERFRVVDGERWLFTGDLAKQAPDGSLTIVGRTDTQIKIRGYRVQLEEVEAAIAAHPDVCAAAVALRTTERGNARLTAYVCPTPGRTPAPADLRRWLHAKLPTYAVPAVFVALDSLPLNANGKIDRGRLPDPAPKAGVGGGEHPSASEAEEILASVWSDAFELGHIDPNATFFELGGDSLIAAAIASDVEDRLGVALDFHAFADDPTITTLAAHVEELREATGDAELPPLSRAPRIGPISFAQARFLRYRSIAGPDIRWNMLVPFRIRGALDPAVLHEALNLVVRRHEILRTSYVEWDGFPLAVVRPPEPAQLSIHDLRADPDPDAHIKQIAEQEQRTPFDLENGPLLRLRLFRVGEEDYRLLRISHHIIHDAADSWTVFFDELARAYEALFEGQPVPFVSEPELQYIDYAFSERTSWAARRNRYRAEVDWWERELQAPSRAVQLPFTRPARLVGERPREDVIQWGLPPEHTAGLDAIGRSSRATYYMSRLAVFAALLAIETGSDDLVIGTPLSNRNRAELQHMIGPFINFRILRLRFRGDPSLRDWIDEVRRTVIGVVSHGVIPWEQLMAELGSRGVRAPQLTARFLAWWAMPPIRFAGLELEPLPKHYGEAWGFRLIVNPEDEAEGCWAELDPKVYDPDGVRAFLTRLKALVAAACAQPDHSLRALHSALPHE